MGNPYLVMAAAGACALILVALAALCLRWSWRIGADMPAQGIQHGFSALRRSYATGQRGPGRLPALIYVELSRKRSPDMLDTARADRYCRRVRGLLLGEMEQWSVKQIAEAGGDSLLMLGQLGGEQFREGCQRFFTELERSGEGQACPPVDVRFGYYRGESKDVPFDEAVRRAVQASRCVAVDGAGYGVYDYRRVRLLEKAEKLERSITRSIQDNRFLLEFQPFVELGTGRMVGGEVLARLSGGEQGLVMPERFLAAVDTTNMHSQFDYYVFQKACSWLSGLIRHKEIRYLSCNFSRRTMSEENFAQKVMEIADQYGVPHRIVALEVTEEEAASSQETMEHNLARLRQAGFAIFLDDFGAGVTSPADLKNLPVQVVKIDKGLLDRVHTLQGRMQFQSVVRMAKAEGAMVLCEGIETASQASYARRAGCDLAQGYYYSQPISALGFHELLPDTANASVDG